MCKTVLGNKALSDSDSDMNIQDINIEKAMI